MDNMELDENWNSEDDNEPIEERTQFYPMGEFSDEMGRAARRAVSNLPDDTPIPKTLLRRFASLLAAHILADGSEDPKEITTDTIRTGLAMVVNGGWTPQVRPVKPMPLKKWEARHRVRIGHILKDCPVSQERMKAWRKRRDEAIQKGNLIPPKPNTPAHRKAGSDVSYSH